jgi:LysR family transcriptional activator of mexEF-oprN operon
VTPVQFRTVAYALDGGAVDLAVTVADELPADVVRRPLFTGGFVCLHDPRYARLGRALTRERYFAHDHVIVSYNGDLRGVVEDAVGLQRNVRVSLPSFIAVGAVVEGSALLATVPAIVARELMAQRPALRSRPLPFALPSSAVELLWRRAVEDDEAVALVRERVEAVAKRASAR